MQRDVFPTASSVLRSGDYDSLGGGIKAYRWLLSCDARFHLGQQQGGSLQRSVDTVWADRELVFEGGCRED